MNQSSLPPELLELRRRAHSGRFIAQHRAFLRVGNRRRVSWSAVLLVAGVTAAVIVLLPFIAQQWSGLLGLVAPLAGFESGVARSARHVLPFIEVQVPYLADMAPAPTQSTFALAVAISLLLLIASLLLPSRLLPVVYLLRLAVIIQIVSVLYFALWAERFPYTLARYTSDMYTVGLAIIAVVPLLFGLTYFVFDFGWARKLLLVALAIAHLAVLIPLQYLLHAALVQTFSLVVLPVLFMLFGALLDVSVVIALYGWGMSWRDRTDRIMVPTRAQLPPQPPIVAKP